MSYIKPLPLLGHKPFYLEFTLFIRALTRRSASRIMTLRAARSVGAGTALRRQSINLQHIYTVGIRLRAVIPQ